MKTLGACLVRVSGKMYQEHEVSVGMSWVVQGKAKGSTLTLFLSAVTWAADRSVGIVLKKNTLPEGYQHELFFPSVVLILQGDFCVQNISSAQTTTYGTMNLVHGFWTWELLTFWTLNILDEGAVWCFALFLI